MSSFIGNFLSEQQCGFRKGYSTQYLNLLENWENSADRNKSFGASLTDFTKTSDCLNHELLTAKLSVHGFTCITVN